MCGAEGPPVPLPSAVRRLVPAMGQGRPPPLMPNGWFPCAGQGGPLREKDVAAGSADPGADGAIRSKGPFRRKASFSAESTPCCGASELFPSVMSL